jgi:hypothetical protein
MTEGERFQRPDSEDMLVPGKDRAGMQQDLLIDLYDDELLNDCYQRLQAGAVAEALDLLERGLCEWRANSSDREWKQYVQYCLLHPLRELLHQDPFTLRVYKKLPHQAIDAKSLDYIHAQDVGQEPPAETSELGRQILACTTRLPVCDGFRKRAQLVAETIDRLAAANRQPTILAVSSGHLREAQRTKALKEGRLGHWVAFDSDADSLQEVRRCYGGSGVETVAGSVRQLLLGPPNLGPFDFIYSTGLFDYLDQPAAKRLTQRLFAMLRSGGQLLISSFPPGLQGRGFMESFMDWHLIYRSEPQMLDLATAIDPALLKDLRLLTEDAQEILFLRLIKK